MNEDPTSLSDSPGTADTEVVQPAVDLASSIFHVLLVEDDDADAELILSELAAAGVFLDVTRATDEQAVESALAGLGVDAVLCDYSLPGFDALRALELIRKAGIEVPLIVVSGGLSDERAAECMRLGATDYVLKERLGRLPHALTQAIQHSRVERARREADRRYLRLFENLPLAIMRATAQGQILQANPAAVAMFGFADLDGLLSTSLFDLEVDPSERTTLAERLQMEGHVLGFKSRTRRADGSEFWFSRAVHAVREEDGRVVETEIIGRDITEQVEAEQSLSRRVARQAVLLELSRAGLEGGAIADFLDTAVELVTRGTEMQYGTILELRPSESRLERVAAYGHAAPIPPDSVRIDASPPGIEILKAELRSAVAFDYLARPETPRSDWMIECGVVVSIAVGIHGLTSPYGVLSVHSGVAREISAEDLQFMQLASTIISVAVERKHGERQRRMLLNRLVTAQEQERKSIAEDIHDDAVQVMTAANMRLELFRMVLSDPVQVDAALKLQETVSLATGRLRELLFQLSPPDFDRYGLATAFRRHLEQFEADSGLHGELRSELDEEPSAQVRILLFRIFQEALANVRKHARATTVTVSLRTVDGGVLMQLMDDGAGVDVSAAEPRAGHLGLASMRERAEIAGGWWRLTSEPGQGTEISTWVPAPREEGGGPDLTPAQLPP